MSAQYIQAYVQIEYKLVDMITTEVRTARSYRPITRPPIDIENERALVCGLPTAIKVKAERQL